VLGREAAEGTGGDLFLSVGEESWLVDNSEHLIGDGGALDGNSWLTGKGFLLFGRNVLGDWDGEEVSFAVLVSDGLHVHGLEELHLVHEAGEWEGPTFRDGLEVLNLVQVKIDAWHSVSGSTLFSSWLTDEGLVDDWLSLSAEDLLLFHMLKNEGNRLIKSLLTSVDVEVTVWWGLVWIGDTSEVLDFTSTGLLVETLNISLFTNLKGGRDVALEEWETSGLVGCFGDVTILGVWGDESNEDDNTSHVEKLGDFHDSADVLGSVFLGETKTLVETSSDNITVEDEAFA
jgi:hypothetical protein